jgi:hypothetical protein
MNRHVTVQVGSGCKHSLTLRTWNHRLLAAGIFSTNTATFPTHWAAFFAAFPAKNVAFSDIFSGAAAGALGADRAATVW